MIDKTTEALSFLKGTTEWERDEALQIYAKIKDPPRKDDVAKRKRRAAIVEHLRTLARDGNTWAMHTLKTNRVSIDGP